MLTLHFGGGYTSGFFGLGEMVVARGLPKMTQRILDHGGMVENAQKGIAYDCLVAKNEKIQQNQGEAPIFTKNICGHRCRMNCVVGQLGPSSVTSLVMESQGAWMTGMTKCWLLEILLQEGAPLVMR